MVGFFSGPISPFLFTHYFSTFIYITPKKYFNMQSQMRRQFNEQYSKEKYEAYLQKVEALAPGALDFRNAETPNSSRCTRR